MRDERVGIALILAQQLLFTLDTAVIHHLSGQISLWQLGFLRSISGLGIAACLATTVGWAVFHTRHPVLQLVRSAATVGYAWVLIVSFSVMPYADATAISYTLAIYVALLAPPILGEVVGSRRYLAVIVGMVGAVLIIKPATLPVSVVYLAVLAGTSLNGLALILTRYLQREDSAVTVLLYVNLGGLVGFLPGISEPWPALQAWPWLAVSLSAGPLGMYCGIVAVRYAEASTLAPFGYVRLFLAMIGASLVFRETPDIASLIGAGVIVVACLLADRSLMRGVGRRVRSFRQP